MSKEVTFGSLFSGIGGMDLGLERAGLRCAWQVEIDEYCRRVLAKHWPDVEKYEDVRTVGKHNLARVDVITGGFPCQDVSVAGKRAGLAGERSGLWTEYFRIIGELRPRVALIENVPGLLTAGFDRVLCDLASIGYDAEWETISACAFGAPHPRRRLFTVAYANGKPRIGQQRGRFFQPQDCHQEWHVSDKWAFHEPPRVANGHSTRLDVRANKAIGNAVVPDVAEWIGRQILRAI